MRIRVGTGTVLRITDAAGEVREHPAWNVILWGFASPPWKGPSQYGARLPRRLKKHVAREDIWRPLRKIAARRMRRPTR